ncbi:Glycine receptor subunit alphaZ1-like protein [Dinothrombium tinctorium]|uniref:Glycine receptor subunit alphaZ1-like protein n=1 Tax=Dinothrombium tinctorium TaxID=1965070 RepID=A0A3S3NVP5_9ACAR|nr:Glycine receptor subunit alphaZ1-like protein [Dinothrombium tinctorium]RWS09878.1 Glycine receptor subunit alphaZ1-like protein [Dinothrombium tinctorium]RWS10062.1 Glycine receptor subunit alphaZ1-like protein [Dinothrombium tinctorium]
MIPFLLKLCIVFLKVNSYFSQKETDGWSPDKLVPNGYKPSKPPSTPVNVEVSVVVHQVLGVNEFEQSFTIEATIEQIWFDPRLQLPDYKSDENLVTLPDTFKSKLWTPDHFFMNTMQGVNKEVQTVPLHFDLLKTSEILMSTRVILKLSCVMDLFDFPQDSQECYIDITSAFNNQKRVNFTWRQFEVLNEKEFSKFEFPSYSSGRCLSIRGPDFSCLRGRIQFFRRLSYYVIRIYAPSFLLVITAFCGFWVPVLGYPARIALIVTPLLTLVTQQTQINNEINVHYVVALHIWMMFCTFFVFMCLIEYALAIVYCHHIEEKKEVTSDHIEERIEQTPTHHQTNSFENLWISRLVESSVGSK